MNENSIMPRSSFLAILLVLLVLYLLWNDQKCSSNVDKSFNINYELMSKTKELQYDLSDLSSKFRKYTETHLDKLNTNDTIIYAITPTYSRPVQKAELVRLSQTLCLLPNMHWIIIEDSAERTRLVTNLIENLSFNWCAMKRITHLCAKTPPPFKLRAKDSHWSKPRGVTQRNAGLHWLRENLNSNSYKGVVYFMDDDNTYDIRLFKEMVKIRRVGVWPVGLVGGMMVEKPIVDNKTGVVVGFNSVFKPTRPFPIDMAGFAINLKLILDNKDAEFSFDVEGGYQESEILKYFTTREQLEPLADNCTKVYVWHTRTEKPKLTNELGRPFNIFINHAILIDSPLDDVISLLLSNGTKPPMYLIAFRKQYLQKRSRAFSGKRKRSINNNTYCKF